MAATVASIAPTPGGLGAMEAALISALTRLAVPGGQAVAATLAFDPRTPEPAPPDSVTDPEAL